MATYDMEKIIRLFQRTMRESENGDMSEKSIVE